MEYCSDNDCEQVGWKTVNKQEISRSCKYKHEKKLGKIGFQQESNIPIPTKLQ